MTVNGEMGKVPNVSGDDPLKYTIPESASSNYRKEQITSVTLRLERVPLE
jgi:hypothetical protein